MTLDARIIGAAARIGELSVNVPTEEASQAVLDELSQVIPYDAAAILSFQRGSSTVVTRRNYDARTVEAWEEFSGTSWYRNVVTRELPPSISTEPDDAFRKGDFYNDHVRPAGFTDGLGMALKKDGEVLGAVYLSCADTVYDSDRQATFAALAPMLTAFIDFGSHVAAALGRVSPDAAMAINPTGDVTSILDHPQPPMAQEDTFVQTLRAFRETNGTEVSFRWPGRNEWWAVHAARAGLRADGVTTVLADRTESPYGLTAKELEVLTLVTLGLSNSEIAHLLVLSPRTVESHVESVLRKTGSTNRGSAAALAMSDSLVWPPAALRLDTGLGPLVKGGTRSSGPGRADDPV